MTTSYIYYILVITVRFTEKLKNLAYLTPLYDWFGKRSFAQSGEDVIAWGELRGKCHSVTVPARPGPADWGSLRPGPSERKGFYVDVGAYHPKLFSNTYLFYKKGWRGICVEPNPEMASLYRVARPRDVFLNVGVGNKRLQISDHRSQMLEYYQFEDGAANTFSAEQARKNIVEAGRKLRGKINIKVKTLKSILDKNLPKGQKIDLLSVDVEGMDEEVLRSNDWKKYRPKMIIAEDLSFDLNKYMGLQGQSLKVLKEGGGVVKFLNSVGYSLVAKTPYSLIFKIYE